MLVAPTACLRNEMGDRRRFSGGLMRERELRQPRHNEAQRPVSEKDPEKRSTEQERQRIC